jgi:hypothetical protein
MGLTKDPFVFRTTSTRNESIEEEGSGSCCCRKATNFIGDQFITFIVLIIIIV